MCSRLRIVASISALALISTLLWGHEAAAQQPAPTTVPPIASPTISPPATVRPAPTPTTALLKGTPVALPSSPVDEWVKAGPDADVDAVATSPRYAEDGVVLAATSAGLWRSHDGGDTWQETTGLQTGDVVQSIGFSPDLAVDKTVFLGSLRTIYRSRDAGLSWEDTHPVGFPVCPTCPNVSSVAVSSSFATDRTLFATTVYGPHRSNDGGTRWQTVGGQIPFEFIGVPDYRIVISPGYAEDQTVFMARAGRVLRSTDGGNAWAELLAVEGEGMGDPSYLAVSPTFPADGQIFLGVTWGSYHSGDWGATWTRSNEGRPMTNAGPMVVPPSYPADSRVYMAVGYGYRNAWRSLDGGVSWVQLGDSLSDHLQISNRIALAVAPTDSPTLFVGGKGGLFRYIDSGRSIRPPVISEPATSFDSPCDPGGQPVTGVPGVFIYLRVVVDIRMLDPSEERGFGSDVKASSSFASDDQIRLYYGIAANREAEVRVRLLGPGGLEVHLQQYDVQPVGFRGPAYWTIPVRPDRLGLETLSAGGYRSEVFFGDALAACTAWGVK